MLPSASKELEPNHIFVFVRFQTVKTLVSTSQTMHRFVTELWLNVKCTCTLDCKIGCQVLSISVQIMHTFPRLCATY